MNFKDIPMVANRKSSLPRVYGDTPSFLGAKVLDRSCLVSGLDIIFAGVPWEGTLTWGSYAGCELAPRSIRHSAARYGGFLPEYEIDIFDYLSLGDIGDVSVHYGDPAVTMRNVYEAADKIYKNESIPFVLGGDHSFTPELVRALNDNSDGKIGIIHFDAHLDNSKSFGDDEYPRCGPLHRISEIPKVRKKSIVHIGIRGPRNSASQFDYAKNMGATIFTIKEIRKRGMESIIDDAIEISHESTKSVFVTICSDCVDAGFNPGGPADFNGLLPCELLESLYQIGRTKVKGLDYVEVYPTRDANSFSSHLAAWAIIYALAGIASNRKATGASNIKMGYNHLF